MRRGGIFDSAAGRLERLTSARASHLFVTFRRGSFFFFFFAVVLVHGKIHPGRGEEEKKLSHPVFLSSAHTPLPSSSSLSLSFSSQRHKDIFILHKARTLMKHRRHKYISMIFFFPFFPSFKSGSYRRCRDTLQRLRLLLWTQTVRVHESQDYAERFSECYTFKNRVNLIKVREAARGDDSHLFPVHLLVSGSGIKREPQLVGHVMTHLFKGNYSKMDLFALEMSRSRLQKCPILTKQDN